MDDYLALIQEATAALGTSQVVATGPARASSSVDGMTPSLILSPKSVEQLRTAMAIASRQGASMVPRGGGTKMHLGNPPASVDVLLSLSACSEIVELDAENLTVVVQCGVRLPALQVRLAGSGLCLPLDPPFPSGATIGGIVSSNSSGPHRLAYGSVRDLILGLRSILPDGRAIHAGGKTVKNVAGYDLDKLFIGSLGTLGVITEVAFRLLPLPKRQVALLATFPSLTQAAESAGKLIGSQLLPSALELLSPEALHRSRLGERTWALAVGLEGVPEAVQRQVTECSHLCQERGALAVEPLEGNRASEVWLCLRHLQEQWQAASPGGVLAKCSVPLSATSVACEAAVEIGQRIGLTEAIQASAGNGIVWVWFAGRAGDEARLAQAVYELRTAAEHQHGSLVIHYAPLAVKGVVSVWGEPGTDVPAMRAIKQELDPGGLMNRGRFVGGL